MVYYNVHNTNLKTSMEQMERKYLTKIPLKRKYKVIKKLRKRLKLIHKILIQDRIQNLALR